MRQKEANQIEFSTVLFDTLFGLILFFNIDLFLEIKEVWHFIFYLTGFFVLIHWWLIFRSADDVFETEVQNSALDLIFGIAYLIFLDYFILLTRTPSYGKALLFLLALFFIDLCWGLIWRFIGKWKTRERKRIQAMEQELNHSILIDLTIGGLFLFLYVGGRGLSDAWFVLAFLGFYLAYVILTFWTKIINIRVF